RQRASDPALSDHEGRTASARGDERRSRGGRRDDLLGSRIDPKSTERFGDLLGGSTRVVRDEGEPTAFGAKPSHRVGRTLDGPVPPIQDAVEVEQDGLVAAGEGHAVASPRGGPGPARSRSCRDAWRW